MDSIKLLHNLKLKLKGNIRVFCRIRPIIQSDLDHINKRMAKDYMPSSIVSKQRMIEIKKWLVIKGIKKLFLTKENLNLIVFSNTTRTKLMFSLKLRN